MLHRQSASASAPGARFRIFIISAVRILGDCLNQALASSDVVASSDYCADLDSAVAKILLCQPHIVLLDAALRNERDIIGGIRGVAPGAKIVVIAIMENPEDIILWVEAGAEGFIPASVAAHEVTPLLMDILRGEQTCTAHVAGSLLRRLCEVTRTNISRAGGPTAPTLTRRELQVLELICAGMSNKEIARHLDIEVATTKSHVHNVLAKLGIQKRGQAAAWRHAYRTPLVTR
jgi:DNA-binding NarL/FixJ family response regulator